MLILIVQHDLSHVLETRWRFEKVVAVLKANKLNFENKLMSCKTKTPRSNVKVFKGAVAGNNQSEH